LPEGETKREDQRGAVDREPDAEFAQLVDEADAISPPTLSQAALGRSSDMRSAEPSSFAAAAKSRRRGLIVGSYSRVGRDLVVIAVPLADGVLELLESLPESATGVGETLGPKEDKRDDEQDDQVGGL
jgi:hypothetical protein